MKKLAGKLSILAGTVFLTGGLFSGMASAQAPPCAITSASVNAVTATFTVGPAECTGTVGPISFSTYELPNGKVLPYNKQVAIAHHPSNGASYGAGTYTLTLTLNGAECWQSDLYYGTTVITPPHPHTIAVDYQQGQCAETPNSTTTSVAPSTVPTTTVAPSTTAAVTTTTIAPTTTTTTTVPAPAVPTTVSGSTLPSAPVNPPTTVATFTSVPPSHGLPATGRDYGPLLAIGLISYVIGLVLTVLSRRSRRRQATGWAKRIR